MCKSKRRVFADFARGTLICANFLLEHCSVEDRLNIDVSTDVDRITVDELVSGWITD